MEVALKSYNRYLLSINAVGQMVRWGRGLQKRWRLPPSTYSAAAASSPLLLQLQIHPLLSSCRFALFCKFPKLSSKLSQARVAKLLTSIVFDWVQFWPGNNYLRQDFKMKKCCVMATKNLSCVENYATNCC